jgi:hypothetical protein
MYSTSTTLTTRTWITTHCVMRARAVLHLSHHHRPCLCVQRALDDCKKANPEQSKPTLPKKPVVTKPKEVKDSEGKN